MTRIKCIFLALVAVLLSQTAMATPINIDFGNEHATPASSYGAAAGQSGIWNNVSTFTPVALADISGIFIPGLSIDLGGSLSCNGLGCGFVPSTDTSPLLLKDNFFGSSGQTWSLLISGLTDGLYDVYYYAPSNTSVSTGAFTINGVSQASISGSANASGLTLGLTHGLAGGISVSGGLMNIVSTSTASFRGLAGLQLVSRTTVPEPGTLALLALGFVGIRLARRRQKV